MGMRLNATKSKGPRIPFKTSLNSAGQRFARGLITKGAVNRTGQIEFTSADRKKPNQIIRNLFLGSNSTPSKDSKAHYRFPFAKEVDGETIIFRSALVEIKRKSLQHKLTDIFNAAENLLDSVDGKQIRELENGDKVFVRKMQMPRLSCRGMVKPKSVNTDNRTMDIVWTTGATVRRRPMFDEPFNETLSLKRGAVRMERMLSGAPYTRGHGPFSDEDVLGVIENAKHNSKEGVSQVRFSKRESVENNFQDHVDGILRNTSVEYVIHEMVEQKAIDGVRSFLVTDWEPISVASVPVGADIGSGTRSLDFPTTENSKIEYNNCEIISNYREMEDKKMLFDAEGNLVDVNGNILKTAIEMRAFIDAVGNSPPAVVDPNNPTVPPAAREPDPAPAPVATVVPTTGPNAPGIATDPVAAASAAVVAERARVADINLAARAHNIEETHVSKYVTEGLSADAFRKFVQDSLISADNDKPTNPITTTVGNQARQIEMREAAMNAVMHRCNPEKYKITDNGREYVHYSFLEMARSYLESNSISCRGLAGFQVADLCLNNPVVGRTLLTTTDFPSILLDAQNKFLRDAYEEQIPTWTPFVSFRGVRDFKSINSIQLGDAPALLKVLEKEEYQRGGTSEAKETYVLETFGRIMPISRQTILNDDTQAFARIPGNMGRKARTLEADLVYFVFLNNPLMGDGNAVFSGAHNNTGTGVISIPGLDTFRSKIRSQVGLDGEILNLVPSWLLVGTTLETVAEQFTARTIPQEADKVNPFGPAGRTRLLPIVEPRLDAADPKWWGTTDKSQLAPIEMARLEGTDGPQLSTRDGFEVDGVETKIRHDVAVKTLDFRGVYESSGS